VQVTGSVVVGVVLYEVAEVGTRNALLDGTIMIGGVLH
jgi:hypothetical protein